MHATITKGLIDMAHVFIKSFMCPYCNTKCSFYGDGVGNSVVLWCNGCGKGVYFQFTDNYDLPDGEVNARVPASDVVDYYPSRVVTVDQSIPEEIADDYKEANRCFDIKAKKATVVMCRRVLQSTCISKGANPNTDLVEQIEELESQRIINPSLKEVAHTIRKIGNWGAHPQDDPLKDVTLEDASELLKFTSEFLDEVFVRPARIDALRKKKGLK